MMSEAKAIEMVAEVGHKLAPPIDDPAGVSPLAIYGCLQCHRIFEVWRDRDYAVGPMLTNECSTRGDGIRHGRE